MAISKATTTKDLAQPAEEKEEGYKVLVSPFGSETTVPDSIVDVLVDSGYKLKK